MSADGESAGVPDLADCEILAIIPHQLFPVNYFAQKPAKK